MLKVRRPMAASLSFLLPPEHARLDPVDMTRRPPGCSRSMTPCTSARLSNRSRTLTMTRGRGQVRIPVVIVSAELGEAAIVIQPARISQLRNRADINVLAIRGSLGVPCRKKSAAQCRKCSRKHRSGRDQIMGDLGLPG